MISLSFFLAGALCFFALAVRDRTPLPGIGALCFIVGIFVAMAEKL